MRKILSLPVFKKRYALTQKEVNALEKRGSISVQQSGFLSHSLCHRKIVVVKESILPDNRVSSLVDKRSIRCEKVVRCKKVVYRREKLGLVEWLPIHKRRRTFYLKLRSEDVEIYDIRPGDLVLAHLRVKKPRGGEND